MKIHLLGGRFFAVLAGLLVFSFFSGCAGSGGMKRGSGRALYTIADPLEVYREDIGKSIQLRLDQKLLFKMERGGENPGEWKLVNHSNRILLLLSDAPRVMSNYQGFLLQARVIGSGEVTLRFTPSAEDQQPQDVKFEISVRR